MELFDHYAATPSEPRARRRAFDGAGCLHPWKWKRAPKTFMREPAKLVWQRWASARRTAHNKQGCDPDWPSGDTRLARLKWAMLLTPTMLRESRLAPNAGRCALAGLTFAGFVVGCGPMAKRPMPPTVMRDAQIEAQAMRAVHGTRDGIGLDVVKDDDQILEAHIVSDFSRRPERAWHSLFPVKRVIAVALVVKKASGQCEVGQRRSFPSSIWVEATTEVCTARA